MYALAFYTSGPGCAVAVANEAGCVAHIEQAMARGQDAQLPALTEALLSEAGLHLQDIQRFGVVVGPGSFTGIRVGVAFARGLALAFDRPCIGISSLQASLPGGQQGSAMVLLPAQKRPPELTFWGQTFRSGEATQAPQELTPKQISDILEAHPHMVFGDGTAIANALPNIAVRDGQPSALRVAELTLQFDPDDHPPEPAYVRAPDAKPSANLAR